LIGGCGPQNSGGDESRKWKFEGQIPNILITKGEDENNFTSVGVKRKTR
jgi:hypothetical protein